MSKKKIGYLLIGLIAIILIIKFTFKDEIDSVINNDAKKDIKKKINKSQKKKQINYKKDVIERIITFSRTGKFRSINIRPVLYSWVKNKVTFEYKWFINDKEIDFDKRVLTSDLFKKGDKVYCIIKPVKIDRILNEVKSDVVIIKNSAPIIKYNTSPVVSMGMFEYKINARDIDNDELIYNLIEAEENMIIDTKTGKINWNYEEIQFNDNEHVKEDLSSYNIIIKFKVTDSEGAETLGSITFNTATGSEGEE